MYLLIKYNSDLVKVYFSGYVKTRTEAEIWKSVDPVVRGIIKLKRVIIDDQRSKKTKSIMFEIEKSVKEKRGITE